MKRIFKFILPFILSIFPFVAMAKVYINEIAWMGTVASWRGEWIELYNDGSLEVNLSDAKIFEKGEKEIQIISLTKKIAPKGYYLIRRTSNTAPDPTPEITDVSGSFGGDGLNDKGEFLFLKLSDGTILDSLDASAGWPAGDSVTKKTMQRADSGAWITATATPRALNARISTEDNNSPQDSVATSTEEDSENLGETIIQIDTITYDSSAYSSPFSLSQSIKEKRKIGLDVGRNRIVLIDSPVFFVGRLSDDSGKAVSGASFDWSFGDGNTVSGQNVSHIYKAPGEYVIIERANFEGEEFVGKSLIKVISPAFSISGIGKDGGDSYIEIENNLPFEANLKGWQLRSGFSVYTFPSDTIILSGKKVRFFSHTTKMGSDLKGEIELVSFLGRTFSSFSSKESGKLVNSAVDKSKSDFSVVDKPVDNSCPVGKVGLCPAGVRENADYSAQLSKMATMLGEMNNSFVAQTSFGNNNDLFTEKVRSIILNEELSKFEPSLDIVETEDFLSATNTENRKIVTLDAPINKKGFWNFIKSLLWQ